MKLLSLVMLFMSVAVSADESSNSGYNNSTLVRCSSIKNRKQTCYADTSGGVQLVEQLSRSSCQNNWGYRNGEIWVDHGCRARFQLYVNGSQGDHSRNRNTNNAGHSNNRNNNNNAEHSNNRNNNAGHSNNNGYNGNQPRNNRVRCESINSKRRTCSIPRGSKVSIHKKLSRSSCTNNWGYNDSSIWVDHGCRAEFNLGGNH